MRVLITGGTGLIGKAATELLLKKGWKIRCLDLKPGVETKGVEYVQGDILNYSQLVDLMRGCDAVIHLAAIRTPHMAPASQVFEVNVAGTFNVFEAAAATGIRRVVQASSINAFGGYYGTAELAIRYLPIDEDHPAYTTDAYAFSKQIIEEIGRYFWRREGISSTALRFPGVVGKDYIHSDQFKLRRANGRRVVAELASLPELERQTLLADVKQRNIEFRQQRPFDFNVNHEPVPNPPLPGDPLFRAYVGDRYNFWAFVDERDAAQSIEKSLTADYEGSHALFINDRVNYLGYESKALATLFFPEVTHLKTDLRDSSALLSIDKARTLIGFEPAYSVDNLQLD
ncbi:MAG: NAD(P)-dependent oxidoreductase [Chloroflexota bacterium]